MVRKTGRKRTCVESDPWAELPVGRFDLLEPHIRASKTDLDVLMAYYKHDMLGMLHKSKSVQLWNLTDLFITQCERSHFKRRHQEREVHMNRMLAYYEWQKLMWHKSPKECRFIFNKAFADFLGVLQCRDFGIALPHGNCLLNVRTKFIKYWKDYFVCMRDNLTYEELYLLKGHKYVYDDVAIEYEYYFAKIRAALDRVPGAVYRGSTYLENCNHQDVFSDDALLDGDG